jgi:NADH dehydrogenase
MELIAHIPPPKNKRIVIIGAGFGGLKIAQKLKNSDYQIVLIDKNNYHQFQPLFYQVATAGLEPSAICFPLRKVFQNSHNVFIRMAEVQEINPRDNCVETSIGSIPFDYLVIATGCDTNFFGNANVIKNALGMKNVSEALALRNHILQNFENRTNDDEDNEKYLNLVIVGGGPTGVEIAGTLAEMRNHILPKDYPEMDFSKLSITIIDGGARLLTAFSEKSSQKAKIYLEGMGVKITLRTLVKDYDGELVILDDGSTIKSNTVIWAAGIIGNKIAGLADQTMEKGNRYLVNEFNLIEGYNNIFAIGDISLQVDKEFPDGYPQVAQVAIQQGINLASNFKNIAHKKPLRPFLHLDIGSMATVGRNKALVELGFIKIYGVSAWFIWMFVHLMSLVGVKNKILIFINWLWNYITYDQSLRLIIKQKPEKKL